MPALPEYRSAVPYLTVILCLLGHGCGTQAGVRGPGQPASGPGGADYMHAAVEAMRAGQGPSEFWVFSPSEPRPERAPVVMFLHGWGAVHPGTYGAWLQHIVRKGHIVIYPRYQYADQLRTPGDIMLSGAAAAVQDAFKRIEAHGPVHPRVDSVVWFGHSMGGVLAVKLAAAGPSLGLPPAGAVLCVQPGGHDMVPIGDLTDLPGETIVELMTGDADTLAGETGARAIARALSLTPGRRIEIIRMRSDRRSRPDLIADHFAPAGAVEGFPPEHIVGGDAELPGGWLRERIRQRRQERYPVDALDFYGFWKIGDALLDAVFRGVNLEYAFGDTPQQRFMGAHSDGVSVVPLLIEPIR